MTATTVRLFLVIAITVRVLDLLLVWSTDYTLPERHISFQIFVLVALVWIVGRLEAGESQG